MFSTSKRWILLGGGVIGAATISIAVGALLLVLSRTNKEIYIYADHGWVRSTIETAKFVRIVRRTGCDINLRPVAEMLSDLYGATIIEMPPRDQNYFSIVPLCGLKESTFYKLPAVSEIWINFCDLSVSPLCHRNKVFAFTDVIDVTDWPCVTLIMRQELVNYKQRNVRRTLRANCPANQT